MQDQNKNPSNSGSDPGSSPRPNKARKLQRGQSAASSSSGRIRRAARACEPCRTSKLRCEAPDPSTDEKRCAHCAKMNLVCEYTNPVPPHVSFNFSSHGRFGNNNPSPHSEGDLRLSKLETNVAKLLDIIERRSFSEGFGDINNGNQSVSSSSQQQSNNPFTSQLAPNANGQSSSLDALAQFAVESEPFATENNDFTSWLPLSGTGGDLASLSAGVNPNIEGDAVAGTGTKVNYSTTPDTMIYSSRPSVQFNTREGLPATGFSDSPNAVSDPGTSHKSTTSQHDAASERYTPAQARPIPKFGSASRMAAFTDPSSHEAPFRSLTYNPDTYRNVEISGEGYNEDNDGSAKEYGSRFDGGKTPKRGQGDPIDRGIFSEEDARSLFAFFRNEISFFLPVFQEPLTFDVVRHRSSFLLCVILAIASKYNCSSVIPASSSGTDPLGTSHSDSRSSHRQKVKPVAEEQWFQIRAMAMSSYFQALISKVHCLEDVQATVLLCAWGLQDRGASPDPWILTGSAYRLAKRLGIHLAAGTLLSGSAKPTARLIASWKTYLCLYAFDRFFTVGFGRPETEGFDPSTIDTSLLLAYLRSGDSGMTSEIGLFSSMESAACIAAYVELANIARDYSRFVNTTLKTKPATCLGEMRTISAELDAFSSRWLWARSPMAMKLGISSRPVRMFYNHIRLCLHSVLLKPISHPDSDRFLQRAGLNGTEGMSILSQCLKKAEDSAVEIIQAFADDLRDDYDQILCYAYDYAYMMLTHSAAVILGLATSRINGLGDTPLGQPGDLSSSQARSRRDGAMDYVTATRYCGTAITALVESNRSANFFPCDMAANLSLIAKEMGMIVSDWASEKAVKMIEARAAPSDNDIAPFATVDTGNLRSSMDFGLFPDLDMFLPPGFFDDTSFFQQ